MLFLVGFWLLSSDFAHHNAKYHDYCSQDCMSNVFLFLPFHKTLLCGKEVE